MSRPTVLLAGYHGRSVEELKQRTEALSAHVVDIRFQPYSQQPGWSYPELAASLAGRYHWFGDYWGNLNYKSEDRAKGFALRDWERGLFQWNLLLRNCA